MKPRINDATTALLRAITLNFVNFTFVVEEIKSRGWASATFSGARHELGLRIEGEGAEGAAQAFAERLEAQEFDLRGHIVADIILVALEPLAGAVRIRIEALTVEGD